MFFVVGFVVSTIGAGATPASALLAPPAMAVAARAGVPPLLMAVMAGNGALAGTLSPFAPTGIVAHGVMARIGLGGVVAQTFAYNALAHAFVGIAGFLVLGGWRLFRRGAPRAAADERGAAVRARALADGGRHCRADRRRGRLRPPHRHDGAAHRRGAHPAADGGGGARDSAHAVGRDADGHRCHGAHRADAGHAGRGPHHGRDRVALHVLHDCAGRGLRQRHRVGLQQHVGRRAARLPADGARPRAAARRARPA